MKILAGHDFARPNSKRFLYHSQQSTWMGKKCPDATTFTAASRQYSQSESKRQREDLEIGKFVFFSDPAVEAERKIFSDPVTFETLPGALFRGLNKKKNATFFFFYVLLSAWKLCSFLRGRGGEQKKKNKKTCSAVKITRKWNLPPTPFWFSSFLVKFLKMPFSSENWKI